VTGASLVSLVSLVAFVWLVSLTVTTYREDHITVAEELCYSVPSDMDSPALHVCSHPVSQQTLFVDIRIGQNWRLCECHCVIYSF